MPSGRAASLADRPLSGLLGIDKPSGPTSMDLLDRLKPLLASSSLFYASDEKCASQDRRRLKPWEKALQKKCGGRLPPKLGQGGTLDPLAEGVLVIGIGAATKQLSQFLHCSKEYETTGLLGTSTTSYDSQEPVMRRAPHTHVDEALIRAQLPRFTGAVKQLPPVFSALRMDGKRLFEYAREGLPLPRPIEPRDVTVHELRLVAWHAPDSHAYEPPTTQVSPEDAALLGQVRRLAGSDDGGTDTFKEDEAPTPVPVAAASDDARPAAFTLAMTVSSGTYVRSIVHDLGTACGSAAHVVRLRRMRQGDFSVGAPDAPGNCLPWSVFEQGLEELEAAKRGDTSSDTRDERGLRAWERAVLEYIQLV
ncbi:tRNA pseudouridine(55) synthase [Malassezia caprae]|uniref:tRNA pseudouridine(55) synthase n=1 Tax=Malassezia caprae TaxID=1381934 RepID=A0AAF0E8V8_9BASI|nr:tRNA pseudouridine(55) synthase [Malassezia caprae]